MDVRKNNLGLRSIRVGCVVGEDDGSTPPESVLDTANLIPNADFKLIKGAGHIPCVEQPEMLSEIISKFLADHIAP